MPTASLPADVPPQRSVFSRVVWLVAIVVALYFCYFSQLGVVGLLGPDEPRYAWIARDMAETGDWITPRLFGSPWFEKPPLYYWGAALSFKLFGASETTARLPSAIAALLATVALAWLGWRVYGSATARWLLLLLPSTLGMIGFSHSAATDMPFSAMLTCAMVPAAVLLGLVPFARETRASDRDFAAGLSNGARFVAAALFGLFLGYAVLAKGPAAIILCSGAVVCWAAYTKRWKETLRLLHPAGIAVFCVVALPWYVLCAVRNPDFLRVFILEHNFKRFLTPEFQHIQPFWFYAGILLLAFLPWTPALLWAVVAGVRRLVQGERLGAMSCFLLSWAGFCLIFFTISRSKLPGYILPAIPAIGLLLARAITKYAPTRRWSFFATSLLPGLALAILFFALFSHNDQMLKKAVAYTPAIELAVAALGAANILLAVAFLFRRRNFAIVAGVVPVLFAMYMVDDALPFTPISTQSSRYLADQIRADQIPLTDLRVAGLKRATLYGLNFYLHTDLHDLNGTPTREVYVLTTGRTTTCDKMPAEVTCADEWQQTSNPDGVRLLHLTPTH
ncbi:MAG TPA: glycosyltransferase family 39 protein [Candidatus Sulfotelmatobacter sp.]|nr:glycosyltransferase family 39 protein [Candidatus Sulfotelmatobacter sp.]